MFATMENGTRVRRSRMKDNRIIGRRIIAIQVLMSRALDTWNVEEEELRGLYQMNGGRGGGKASQSVTTDIVGDCNH